MATCYFSNKLFIKMNNNNNKNKNINNNNNNNNNILLDLLLGVCCKT